MTLELYLEDLLRGEKLNQSTTEGGRRGVEDVEAVLSFWRPGRPAPPRLSCGGAQAESGDLESGRKRPEIRYAEPGTPGHSSIVYPTIREGLQE